MNYDLTRTNADHTSLTEIACRGFVGLSVTVAVFGLWSKGWLPGLLLTVAMMAVVYLSSISLGRLEEALRAGAWRTAAQTTALGAGFVSIEAALNHVGLAHLNSVYDLTPVDWVWPTCWLLCLVNVFATDTFLQELPRRTRRRRRVAPQRRLPAK